MSRLSTAAFFIVVVIAAGVLGYHFLEGYTWFEALYMTIITLSTVGFQEVRPLSAAGRTFTILLLVGGLGAVFYTTVYVAATAVEGEFQQFFGRRRMQKAIESLSGHYLVCGFGRIGEVICRELASKPVPFVVVEQQEDRLRAAEQAQYLAVPGDAADEKTLLAAGIAQARGLFAALTNDAANVYVVLTAKELNRSLFVVARAESERSQRTLMQAGANKVISPYAMGGHRMAQAVLRPAVVDIVDLATHHQSLELQLEEISVPAHSPCRGVTLQESGLHGLREMILVAIKRASGKMVFNPAPDEKIEAGDSLVAMAEARQLKRIEKRIKGEME